MEIIESDIDKLIPANYNPRKDLTPKDAEYQKLRRSIDKFGYVDPVIWNRKTGKVVGGHQRLKVLKDLGYKKISVVAVDIEDASEKALNIALNKISGEWDLDKLSSLLVDINTLSIDFELTGFSEKEFLEMTDQEESGLTDDDDVPEPAVPVCGSGEIFVLGDHRLLCGDAAVRDDVEHLMDGKKADMVFTDPPYGVSYAAKNEYLNAISRGNRIQVPIKNDHKNEAEIQTLWKAVFEIIRDNLADVNSYYITGPQIQGMMMMMMMMQEAGLPYRHVIIWVKNNHVLGRCDYNYKHEPIFFGWTKTHKFYGKGQFKTSVWEVAKPHKSDLHPTMKPVELIVNAILNSSCRGQICLDPFLGSGSTLIACEKTNRICYGMEIDPHYCDVIIKRWEEFSGKKAERIK